MAATVDKSGERVRKMFGEIAPNYDRMNHLLSMNVDRLWRQKTVRVLKPDHEDEILDVCTGTGDLAFAFLKKLQGQCRIVASDFCPEMLEIGREKKSRLKQNQNSIEFVQADAQELPFKDGQFNIVTVAFGLRNVADTMAGLRELTRVCQPGGQVAVLEFSTPRRQPIKAAYQWYFKNILPRIGQALARNTSEAYEYLPQSVGEFPSYQELTAMMIDSGLKEARFYPLTFGVATLYVGRK